MSHSDPNSRHCTHTKIELNELLWEAALLFREGAHKICHNTKRLPKLAAVMINKIGRDDWIRTSDLTHPKRARYQAAPRPVRRV